MKTELDRVLREWDEAVVRRASARGAGPETGRPDGSPAIAVDRAFAEAVVWRATRAEAQNVFPADGGRGVRAFGLGPEELRAVAWFILALPAFLAMNALTTPALAAAAVGLGAAALLDRYALASVGEEIGGCFRCLIYPSPIVEA